MIPGLEKSGVFIRNLASIVLLTSVNSQATRTAAAGSTPFLRGQCRRGRIYESAATGLLAESMRKEVAEKERSFRRETRWSALCATSRSERKRFQPRTSTRLDSFVAQRFLESNKECGAAGAGGMTLGCRCNEADRNSFFANHNDPETAWRD